MPPPTTNKAGIMIDIGTRLAAINGVAPFRQTVRAVFDEMLDYDAIPTVEIPALCFATAKTGTPPPKYEMFGSAEKYLDVEILGFVPAPTNEEGLAAIAELERDVNRTLMIDPTRGGWAISTQQVDDSLDDTGTPPKEGRKGDVAWALWRFRSTYYPDD